MRDSRPKDALQRERWKQVEEAWGMKFWDVVRMLAGRGLNKTEVGELVGYSKSGFKRVLSEQAPGDLAWPGLRRRSRGVVVAYGKKRRASKGGLRNAIWIEVNGRTRPASYWARVVGVDYRTIVDRWRKGRSILTPPMAREERGRMGNRMRKAPGMKAT